MDDPVALTQALVRIDSSNPVLGSTPGPAETEIAHYIGSWLEHRNIETHRIEPMKGGETKERKLYRRGADDMKCGIAAVVFALAASQGQALRGDVIFTGVADEDIGTEHVLGTDWRADDSIVAESTA
ncbi:hypothetical protein ED733_007637 [Metarhizium rileyi]|uniref:Uncharacterized protein n=1 Tax=Metarhizium rileyi (strain RCEF 4871) TaxID=1649241 RepID=A0A5C6GK33_METRR|nr:hypothetical protein ED733_007637 [Metarhizium rileyi]